MTPNFLTLEEVLEIHQDQIARYGGIPGLRDMGLLESAAAMPASGFEGRYLHADLFEMAAAYLYHIVRNHPFLDGNKRTGTVAALVFLVYNDVIIETDDNLFEQMVLGVAAGTVDKSAVAGFFRDHAVPAR